MATEIMKVVAGSHLYGTSTPESDTDYKAVHLPSARDILLERRNDVVNKSTGNSSGKNGASDVDYESFSLRRYLQLASEMNTIPVEMLFIPQRKLLVSSPTWEVIRQERHRLISKNAHSFVGYCRGQAVRYSARGIRLETFETMVAILETMVQNKPLLEQDYSALKNVPAVDIVARKQPGGTMVPYLVAFGRQSPMTCKVKEILEVFERPITEYGKRARKARDEGGADWKALYHAVRIADEGIQLFQTGKITFPSQVVPLLQKIRAGVMDLEGVLDIFDQKIVELEHAVETSGLPEHPDRAWIDEFVAETHYNIVMGG